MVSRTQGMITTTMSLSKGGLQMGPNEKRRRMMVPFLKMTKKRTAVKGMGPQEWYWKEVSNLPRSSMRRRYREWTLAVWMTFGRLPVMKGADAWPRFWVYALSFLALGSH